MAHAIMVKKLPHGLTLQDLDELLERTDLQQHTKRRHIPRYIIDRRHDIYGPLAIAFVHFESFEHAELGIKSLWHQCVWDRDAECERRITADHTHTLWEPPTPEVSPEPSHTTKTWEDTRGRSWSTKAKPVPPPDDANLPPTPNEALLAITDDTKDNTIDPHSTSSGTGFASNAVESTKDKKAKAKPIQNFSNASNSWDKQSWDQPQWDKNSFHDHSDAWWTRPENTDHMFNFPLQQDLPLPPACTDRPRYRCIACYIPFLKWSQCKHHMITVCLPVGKDPSMIDDDEDIKKICERLCAPFETPNSSLAA